MLITVLMILGFMSKNEPCWICKGKGGYYEYRIQYEVADPEYCNCFRCNGKGWLEKKKK